MSSRAVALVAFGALLAGCGSAQAPAAIGPATPTVDATNPLAVEQALLTTRADAVRSHNLAEFLSGDDPTETSLIASDRRYFAAASSLPWVVFDYRVTSTPWPQQLLDPHWGSSARIPEVILDTQLEGYDTDVLSRTTGFAFVTRGGHTYIASDRTIHGHLFPGYQPDPWDVEPVTVMKTPTTIGVFDAGTAAQAARVMADLGKAVTGVGADVPYAWTHSAVLYALSGSTFSSALTGAPDGDLTHLGAITYPLNPVTPGADSRILLLGQALASDADTLARIVRHEVTHVALGAEQVGVPLWLVEGIAEYEGAKAVPASRRTIPALAIQRAKGKVGGMPASTTFHGSDQEWNYALSRMACTYIAQTGGEQLLWSLLGSMNNGGLGTTDAHEDLVLEQVLGMTSAQLAGHAAALIRSTYG